MILYGGDLEANGNFLQGKRVALADFLNRHSQFENRLCLMIMMMMMMMMISC